MSEKQFERLVGRLESYARQHPTQYKLKVALVAGLGYAYVLAVLGLALAIGAWLLVSLNESGAIHFSSSKMLFGAGVFAAIILRAFWVRLSPPSGLEVHREEAPRLFLLIDKLTDTLGTPPFHHVFIVNDLNAAVAQTPRLGIFGWHRNSLLLGLPLMLAMTPVQFRAVLAHEFAHLGRQHGRFSAWIYRTRMVWSRLLEELKARNHWGSILFTKFLVWYAPFFNAYSFVLARAQEYEADRQASRLVGCGHMKDALATVHVIARMMDDLYWPALNRRTITNPTPPAAHLEELTALLQWVPASNRIQGWMKDALQQNTGYTDTHPSLTDRLAALDLVQEHSDTQAEPSVFPQLRTPQETAAAEYYLGAHAAVVREALDRSWAESVTDQWELKHREMAAARARCQALSDKSATVGLSTDELWEYACQMEALESDRAALPVLKQLLAKDPNHAAANLAMGRHLLREDDQAGLQYLENAIAQDRDAVIPACQLASTFLTRRGNHKESMRYQVKAQRQQQQLLQAETERCTLRPGDSLNRTGCRRR